MKPVIKIWCLPHDQKEEDYRKLHQAVVAAAIEADVGIKSQNDMVVLMPRDLMEYGLGQEIIIEIGFVELKHLGLIDSITKAVKILYPKAWVQGELLTRDKDGNLFLFRNR